MGQNPTRERFHPGRLGRRDTPESWLLVPGFVPSADPMDHSDLAAVLRHYPIASQPSRVEFLGNAGGFSGSRLWKLHLPSGRLCLRRWPGEYPTEQQLRFIHSLLLHVGRSGYQQAPAPLRTNDCQTFVTWRRHRYELTPWIDGKADFREQPTHAKLTGALQALAEFHVRAGTLPASTRFSPSAGLRRRLRDAEQLRAGELSRLQTAIRRNSPHSLADASVLLLDAVVSALPALHRELSVVADRPLALQPCIRDVWHDHVLYAGSRVAGIVDFGACGLESVAGDIARLLGSLVGDDADGWSRGLAAYHTIRPLSESELNAVRSFDHANVVLAGTYWVRWVFGEQRQFDTPRVAARLAEIHGRLRQRLTSGSALTLETDRR